MHLNSGAAIKPFPETQAIMEVRGLGFHRGGRWLFRNLDFDLQVGDFVALVGPSGVGKTTLLSCLCGLRAPSEGSIRISLPKYSTAQPPAGLRRHFGIVFQDLQLIQNANLLTNVLCGRLGALHGLRTLLGFPKQYKLEAYALLNDLGVAADPEKWACEMSGGEQQRVAIARALFQKPEIYFADEPVSSLDSYYSGRVLGLLKQAANVEKKAVFCVLHNSEHIQRFANIALSLNPQDPTACRIRRLHPTAEAPQSQ